MDKFEAELKELEDIESQLTYLEHRKKQLRNKLLPEIKEHVRMYGRGLEGPSFYWTFGVRKTRKYDTKVELEVHVNGQTIISSIDSLKNGIKQLELSVPYTENTTEYIIRNEPNTNNTALDDEE